MKKCLGCLWNTLRLRESMDKNMKILCFLLANQKKWLNVAKKDVTKPQTRFMIGL